LAWPSPELARLKSSPFSQPFKDEDDVMAAWGEARLIKYLDG
jgi:hypothetical protein